ncbi:hypothetical protein SODALDRAFT_354249 [Sodiomyces alkalinus F11]|uniref:Uncharacterized protein n=1 Tax=Sodiomyces alkalinus (strain CBS 110278 / VKM F-3762 / F11) TaxID=1314773 RepID=A0A3N2Q676_SODAK|nr:hypothetical protein SODALDRAFT_354249 [Sodiomyces alkalinus F11]ROT42125.1 hypothetical protein SODALDRAFT_354249 [Sodiomyces alkalinus F11]
MKSPAESVDMPLMGELQIYDSRLANLPFHICFVNGQRTTDNGQWTIDNEQWTMDSAVYHLPPEPTSQDTHISFGLDKLPIQMPQPGGRVHNNGYRYWDCIYARTKTFQD